MRNSEEKRTMSKTRKAFDWVLSCLIRFPIFVLGLLGIIVTIFIVALIFSPETATEAWNFIKNIF